MALTSCQRATISCNRKLLASEDYYNAIAAFLEPRKDSKVESLEQLVPIVAPTLVDGEVSFLVVLSWW